MRPDELHNLDIRSVYVENTLSQATLELPFYCLKCGTFYCRSGFCTDLVPSPDFIILHTFAGSGFVYQGSSIMKLEPGSCVIVNRRTSCRLETMVGSDVWSFRWCVVAGVGVESIFPRINPVNAKLTPVMIDVVRTEKDLDRIQLICKRNLPNDDLVVSVRVHSILFSMCQARDKENPSDDLRRNDIFAAAYYIQTHYAQRMDISELSARFCISKYHFVRLFKKYIGTTPYDFLLLYRIERAKDFLITTQNSVHDISELVGFTSDSNFSTRFTKITGMSPSDFRKANYRCK